MNRNVLISLFLIFSMCSGISLGSSNLSDVEEVWCKSALSNIINDDVWVDISNLGNRDISLDAYYLKYNFLKYSLTESMIKISNSNEEYVYKSAFGIPTDTDIGYLFLFALSDNEIIQENRIELCKLWYSVNQSG